MSLVAEAKRRLGELREETEQKQKENQDLQVCSLPNAFGKMNYSVFIVQTEVALVGEKLFQVEEKWHHLSEESEVLKEQLALAQDHNHHFTQTVSYTIIVLVYLATNYYYKMTELQDKLEETYVLLKESKDENLALKDQALQLSASSIGDSTQVEVCNIAIIIICLVFTSS